MRNKEVISMKDGCRIGCVNDVEVDMKCAKIIAIVVYGKPKLFGLLGREDDIIIKWENIEVIGDDTILVNINPTHTHKRKMGFFGPFFRPFK